MQYDQMSLKNKRLENCCSNVVQVKPPSSAVRQFADSKFELIDHCQLHIIQSCSILHESNKLGSEKLQALANILHSAAMPSQCIRICVLP